MILFEHNRKDVGFVTEKENGKASKKNSKIAG